MEHKIENKFFSRPFKRRKKKQWSSYFPVQLVFFPLFFSCWQNVNLPFHRKFPNENLKVFIIIRKSSSISTLKNLFYYCLLAKSKFTGGDVKKCIEIDLQHFMMIFQEEVLSIRFFLN
jgi:hypothetical protein